MADDTKHPSRRARCANCSATLKVCRSEKGTGPAYCPTLRWTDVLAKVRSIYRDPAIRRFARMASLQEAECYVGRGETKPYVLHPVKPRVLEVCEFAEKMGYKKLGVAFCSGLAREAEMLVKILEHRGFEVVSVVCKVGGVPKETLGLKEDEKICPGEFESMCNPIGQAMVLNEEGTDFNVLVGLCVGHDSLFLKHAGAPCTVLVVKDRVTGHNPAAVLYTSGSYYQRLLKTGGKP
ncbi:MAG: DUF1847 domain-containing protein [Candidatus Eisenbacteria bacterium]|nr:DUF1847 domain-containing protein [Candidatus Eisenbacteria bacterium]